MNDTKRILEKYDKGDIISMDSILAFDEDMTCKRCNAVFTLAESKWKGTHPKYKGVQAHGVKCPNCERVNVAYYKSQKLIKLESRLRRVFENNKSERQITAALNKYKKEFLNVQKFYGEIGSVSEKAQN